MKIVAETLGSNTIWEEQSQSDLSTSTLSPKSHYIKINAIPAENIFINSEDNDTRICDELQIENLLESRNAPILRETTV